MFRDTQEAIAYIEDRGWSTTRFGLSRTRILLNMLGDPQKKLRFVHVAGSNGKGSTCAMLDSIFRKAGYKTGLYISPYIQKFNERIQVDGQLIPDQRLLEITEKVAACAEAMDDRPTHFELVTAIGMEYFMEEGCDMVILEVGMGGEFDSTNVIDVPDVAVITNIGLEHTQWLGNTLEEIAATKSGIIKPGCRAVCYDGAPEVSCVVKDVCEKKQVPLTMADFSQIEPISETLDGQHFRYKGREYSMGLLGTHQLRNGAVVVETVGQLRQLGWKISDDDLYQGMAEAHWPARFEVIQRAPLFILDGGHNPQCMEALTESLRVIFPEKKFSIITGVLADKNFSQMMESLIPFAEQFFCLTPDSPRALKAAELADFLRSRGAKASICNCAEDAMKAAKGRDTLACGSLYLAGEIRTLAGM